MKPLEAWLSALVLSVGALFTVGIDMQRTLPLTQPLDSVIPTQISGRTGWDTTIPDPEIQAAGLTNYLLRNFSSDPASGVPEWSVYIGYYDRQLQGKSIHSPKNCLPGAGWEPLASTEILLETSVGTVPVNRYLLKKKQHEALVLYWYQGRGRVAANEYVVKLDLLRDAALRQRSDEALVRVVVPITDGRTRALEIAADAARKIVPALNRALPS